MSQNHNIAHLDHQPGIFIYISLAYVEWGFSSHGHGFFQPSHLSFIQQLGEAISSKATKQQVLTKRPDHDGRTDVETTPAMGIPVAGTGSRNFVMSKMMSKSMLL